MVSKGYPVTMNYNDNLSIDYTPRKGLGFKAEEERFFITHRWEF
jgi:hypothetical protein